MKRAEFLSRLRTGLSGLSPADIDELIADYDAHFSEGLAAGRSEEELAIALGDPARLARELRAEAGIRKWETRRTPGNYLGALFALIGIAAFDLIVLLPLLLVVGVILSALGMAMLGIVIAGFTLLAVFGDGSSTANVVVQVLIAVGLVSGAVGGGAVILLLFEAILKWLARYARLHYRLLNPHTESA